MFKIPIYKLFHLVILLLINVNLMFGQRTINDIEEYILSPFFGNDFVNNNIQIIEENENAQITRKWIFNDEGKLFKECDWRESSFSSSFGISSKTSYKEYLYSYNSTGNINKIIETQIQDGDTINTIHEFEYTSKNEIKEFYNFSIKNVINTDFVIQRNYKNGVLKSIERSSITYIGEGFVKSTTKDIHEYANQNNLSKKMIYYSVESSAQNENNETDIEELGLFCKYHYDHLGRINEILEINVDDKDENLIHRKISFQYEKDDSKISTVTVKHDESYSPSEMKYEIEYQENGRIKKIKINNNLFNYHISRVD